jgi:hypothetical protein
MKPAGLLIGICLLLLLPGTPLYAQKDDDIQYEERDESEYPIYFKETKDSFRRLTDIPRDTIHDTIYVSDIDAFLKQYNCDLKAFATKYGAMKSLIDSLNNLPEEKLYYNFFRPHYTGTALSDIVVAEEYAVEKNGTKSYAWSDTNLYHPLDTVSRRGKRSILFRCDGAEKTDLLITNKEYQIKNLSALFTRLKDFKENHDDKEKISNIILFFPDFTFKEKRAMMQFIRTVELILMAGKSPDAAFSYHLTTMFCTDNGEAGIDRIYRDCLFVSTGRLIYLDRKELFKNFIKGYEYGYKDTDKIISFKRIFNFYYRARYYTGKEPDEPKGFSESEIAPYLEADFDLNDWEYYFWAFVGVAFLSVLIVVLYFCYWPVSIFINQNMDIMLMAGIGALIEIVGLGVVVLQKIVQYSDDSYIIFYDNPILILSLPALFVVCIPVMKSILKYKRLP